MSATNNSVPAVFVSLASPTFTGNPKAPTPSPGDSTTSIATTAFVTGGITTAAALKANLASPVFTGSPQAPTQTLGDSTVNIATTAFVANGLALKANLASPTFTGTPAAPTATIGDSSTVLATTAFVAGTVAAATLPAQAGNGGKLITTDGTSTVSWVWAATTGRSTIASSTTTSAIWANYLNQIDWTGTATTPGFPAAPVAGMERTVICAAACSFTAGANMLIDGVTSGNTVTCAAGDQVLVKAISTTQFKLTRIRYDGHAQVETSSFLTYSSRVSNTILAAADRGTLIDVTSGSFTQTFTAAATLGSGWYCTYRNSGSGTVTLDPNASETIGGAATCDMLQRELGRAGIEPATHGFSVRCSTN